MLENKPGASHSERLGEALKQLSKDTAVYGVSTIVGRFLNFLLVPFYTNIFLPEEYGIITNIYAFIAILNIIFIYGMDAAYLRFAKNEEIGNEKDIFSTPYFAVLIFSLIFSLIIIWLKVPLGESFAVPDNYNYLFLFVASILFTDAIAVIPFIRLRIERRSKKFAAFKIINIVINVSLNLYLILKLKMGIEAVFISNLVASVITFFLLTPSILKLLNFSFSSSIFKRMLKFGLPYLPAGLGSILIQVIDRPIMEHLTDLNTLGIYQANHKLGIFMMLFVSMFQYAWQPFFMQESKSEDAKKIFSRVLTYFTLVASIILIVLSLFIDNIIRFEIFGKTIIGQDYWSGVTVVPVILFAYMFNGLYVVFTAGIYIKEKSIYVPLITGAGAVVNIISNFILIPVLGMMGAALSVLASYIVMAAGLYFVTQKFYKINYEKKKIAIIFLLILLFGAIYYFLYYNIEIILIYKFLMLILFLASILFFVIDKKEIEFIKNKFSR
ncbi:MAG TPA: oligosaccharide flippase family protein [Ignavibacteriaceae bacterium]